MLEYHKAKGADATIAVLNVPIEEASRFGIMNTDSEGRIVEFEEKPKMPKSNLASMGIYIFNWKTLSKCLIEDEMNLMSSHDFGKNIIPTMIKEGYKMYAYAFKGYWKDVGTIESYYEANMELLKDEAVFDLYDPKWKIYSKNSTVPPSHIGPNSGVRNSMINEGCTVLGKVENSILFAGVYVGVDAVIKDSIIFENTRLEKGSRVEKAILGEGVKISENAIVDVCNCDKLKSKCEKSHSNIILIPDFTII